MAAPGGPPLHWGSGRRSNLCTLIHMKTDAGSLILSAVYSGAQSVVEVLLAAGPELTIHEAAATGSADRIRALLAEEPGLVNACDGDGFDPLGVAAYRPQAGLCFRLSETKTEPPTFREPEANQLQLDGQSLALQVIPDQAGRVLNRGPKLDWTLVLPDGVCERLLAQAPAEQRILVSLWAGAGWRSRAGSKSAGAEV